MSAYLLYQNAMRETFKAQNPGMTFGQLAKYTSAMYAELSPVEKEAWVATLALSREHMQSIHAILATETTAEAVDLSTLAPISRMSNLEVRVKVKS